MKEYGFRYHLSAYNVHPFSQRQCLTVMDR
jgi:hypothetical protein